MFLCANHVLSTTQFGALNQIQNFTLPCTPQPASVRNLVLIMTRGNDRRHERSYCRLRVRNVFLSYHIICMLNFTHSSPFSFFLFSVSCRFIRNHSEFGSSLNSIKIQELVCLSRQIYRAVEQESASKGLVLQLDANERKIKIKILINDFVSEN